MGRVLTADEEERSQDEIICTGQGEIDKKLGGGIPVGSLTLIEGQSDAGKSVVSQQMIWGALNTRHKVILFTTENTVKSMNTQMESLGLSILDQLLLGWIKVFTIEPSKMKNINTFSTILTGILSYPSYRLVIIDSLTPVLGHTSIDQIIDYFEACKKLCDGGRTIINVAHTYAFDEQVLIRIRSVCDAHLRLRIEEVGDKLVKVLEVAKVRGADKSTGNIMSFDVEPGLGMRIMPLGRAKA
ncbi:MAG: ATPase domain-containing protein [Dehalococcoidia bacterium]|nr:ATPase domain-containing protein [Dehalococcoidia bacterium]MDD5494892.1 ATPase domain-containing protein [Dehalococcoidia bacterium]